MSGDNGHELDPVAEQAAEAAEAGAPSRITIAFAGPGLADATIALEGVTPGQVMSAAWFLDRFAHELRDRQQATAPQLVIPANGRVPGPIGKRMHG